MLRGELQLLRLPDGTLRLADRDGDEVLGQHVVSVHTDPERPLKNWVTVTFDGSAIRIIEVADPLSDPPLAAVPDVNVWRGPPGSEPPPVQMREGDVDTEDGAS